MTTRECGGCRGIGAHQRYCVRHPEWHPWRRLADEAEAIGDQLGDPALANQAWALAGAIRRGMVARPAPRLRSKQADA